MRPLHYVIFVCWFACLGWLLITKILPTLTAGNPPRYDFPDAADAPRSEVWALTLTDQQDASRHEIGLTVTSARRHADGSAEMATYAELRKLPLNKVAAAIPLLGQVAGGRADMEIDLTLESQVRLDSRERIRWMDTRLKFPNFDAVFHVRGRYSEAQGKLIVQAELEAPGREPIPLLTDRPLDLGGPRVSGDGLGLQPRMNDLQVGQSWSQMMWTPTAMGFELIEAEVVGRKLITRRGDDGGSDDEPVNAYHVTYVRESATSAGKKQPLSEIFVSPDGVVLKQIVRWATLQFRLERLPERDPRAQSALAHLQLWDETADPFSPEERDD